MIRCRYTKRVREQKHRVIARTEANIASLGKVAIVIYGNLAIRAAVGAMWSVFAQIRRTGGISEVEKALPSVEDIIGLQGDDYMRRVEAKFLR